MRIISGDFRSRKIEEVKSDKTRPTTDRNREALFNILGQYFSGGEMLDLFAGSGALGIEALSRGINKAYFIDNYFLAQKTIYNNLNNLKLNDRGFVIKEDAFVFLKNSEMQFDLIIVDPPYALDKYDLILELIVTRQLIKNNGIIVFEADKKTELIQDFQNCYKYKEKIFGNTKFAFYKMEVLT